MSSKAVDQKRLEVRLEVQDACKALPQEYRGKEVRVRPVAVTGEKTCGVTTGWLPVSASFGEPRVHYSGGSLWCFSDQIFLWYCILCFFAVLMSFSCEPPKDQCLASGHNLG